MTLRIETGLNLMLQNNCILLKSVICFIDNCGKYIVKGYCVNAEKNSTPNVIASCINIPWKNNKQYQCDPLLKPGSWMNDVDEEKKQSYGDINY